MTRGKLKTERSQPKCLPTPQSPSQAPNSVPLQDTRRNHGSKRQGRTGNLLKRDMFPVISFGVILGGIRQHPRLSQPGVLLGPSGWGPGTPPALAVPRMPQMPAETDPVPEQLQVPTGASLPSTCSGLHRPHVPETASSPHRTPSHRHGAALPLQTQASGPTRSAPGLTELLGPLASPAFGASGSSGRGLSRPLAPSLKVTRALLCLLSVQSVLSHGLSP